jgi:hypothetical protein
VLMGGDVFPCQFIIGTMFELLIDIYYNYLKRNVLGLTNVVWSFVVLVSIHNNVKRKLLEFLLHFDMILSC